VNYNLMPSPMAHISPFRALRYDPSKVDPGKVVTQPYDKISPEMRDRYYHASPNNLVRIILGKSETQDNAVNNPYTRAAQFFQDWRRQGIFLQDSQPSIYVYVQRFPKPGSDAMLERRGFIALGRLEDYSAGIVHRHEQTLAKPKADRLELLRATRAHFGQLFMLYSDPAGEIDSLLTADSAPDLEITDEYGVVHQLRCISDPPLIGLVRGKMKDKKLIIADGHHRYETALHYSKERSAAAVSLPKVPRPYSGSDALLSDLTDAAPHEFVMMTFINMDNPGLVILPTHRVVHGLPSFGAEDLRVKASEYFSVEEVDPSVDAQRARIILREAGRMGTALLAVTRERVYLMDRGKYVPPSVYGGLSLRQQALDVVQLHKCILESALGMSEESIRNQEHIRYVRDISEAMDQVRHQQADAAFLMNPVRMEQVREIAFAGEVLPQKSTDFYPKLLSGLTIYALE
jgi:uncharacterized protein (DUF1015 family)